MLKNYYCGYYYLCCHFKIKTGWFSIVQCYLLKPSSENIWCSCTDIINLSSLFHFLLKFLYIRISFLSLLNYLDNCILWNRKERHWKCCSNGSLLYSVILAYNKLYILMNYCFSSGIKIKRIFMIFDILKLKNSNFDLKQYFIWISLYSKWWDINWFSRLSSILLKVVQPTKSATSI